MSDWQRNDEYGSKDFIRDHADHFVERARFQGHYHNDPDRLRVLIDADEFKDTTSLEHWRYIAETYPKFPIEADELTKEDNEDVPVRAHYLRKSLLALLEIIEAPANMRLDVDRYFREFKPREAEKYAAAQKELLRDEHASISVVSKNSNCDRSSIHKLLKAGVLVRP